MGIDLKKIESMRADLERERAVGAEEKELERRHLAVERVEQQRNEKFQRVDKIIAELQTTIEAATLKTHRFETLLSISADELLHEPRKFFFNTWVEVHIGGGNPNRILRGYKPGCLPEYARKLFDYCEKNGLITLLQHGSHYYDGFNSANMANWKRYSYQVKIYW